MSKSFSSTPSNDNHETSESQQGKEKPTSLPKKNYEEIGVRYQRVREKNTSLEEPEKTAVEYAMDHPERLEAIEAFVRANLSYLDNFDEVCNALLYKECRKRRRRSDYDITSRSVDYNLKIAQQWLEKRGDNISQKEQTSIKIKKLETNEKLKHVNEKFKEILSNTPDKLEALKKLLIEFPDENSIEHQTIHGTLHTLSQLQTHLDTPEKKNELSRIINSSPVDLTATSSALRYSEIIGLVNTSEVFSDEEKATLCQEMGVSEIYIPEIKTGDDMLDALDLGYGVDENGEAISYSKELPLQFKKDTIIYPQGSDIVVKVDFGQFQRTLRLDHSVSGSEIGEKVAYLRLMNRCEQNGWNGLFGEGFNAEHSEVDRFETILSKRIYDVLGGITAGYDGEISPSGALENLDQVSQWFLVRGDAGQSLDGRGDYAPELAQRDFKNLGMPGGITDANFDIFAEAIKYTRANYKNSTPDYYALQQHLHKKFGDRVPLIEESKNE